MASLSYLDNYRLFRQRSIKRIDTWTEKLLCDELGAFLSYVLVSKYNNKNIPYLITFMSFGFRLVAALFFIFGMNLHGAVVFFISMVSDCVDGMCSRAVFGIDPELRGTLDVMFDVIGLTILLFAVGFANPELRLLVLVYSMFLYIYEFGAATRYRLYSKLDLDVDLPIDKNASLKYNNVKKSFTYNLYLKIRDIFESRGFLFYPTVVDAEFILFVIAPIFEFSTPITDIAILFCLIDAFLANSSSIFIAMNLKS